MIRRTAQRGGMVVGMIVLCLLEAVLLIIMGQQGAGLILKFLNSSRLYGMKRLRFAGRPHKH